MNYRKILDRIRTNGVRNGGGYSVPLDPGDIIFGLVPLKEQPDGLHATYEPKIDTPEHHAWVAFQLSRPVDGGRHFPVESIRHLESAAGPPPSIRSLSPLQRRAYDIILEHQPIQGTEICQKAELDQGTLTSSIIPALKPLGILNGPSGYYISD